MLQTLRGLQTSDKPPTMELALAPRDQETTQLWECKFPKNPLVAHARSLDVLQKWILGDDLEMRTRTTNSVVRAVPKIFHYEARTIAHVDVILISS